MLENGATYSLDNLEEYWILEWFSIARLFEVLQMSRAPSCIVRFSVHLPYFLLSRQLPSDGLQEHNTFGLATLTVQIKFDPVIIQDLSFREKNGNDVWFPQYWGKISLLNPCDVLIGFPYFFLISALNRR
jgi:hypothetical protein